MCSGYVRIGVIIIPFLRWLNFFIETIMAQKLEKGGKDFSWIQCSVYSFFLLIQDQFTLTTGHIQNKTCSAKSMM